MTTEQPAGLLREAAQKVADLLNDAQIAWGDFPDLDDAHEELIAALAATGDSEGPLDVERLARAIEVVSEGRPEYIVTGAEHAIYWTNEMVAKHIAAEYARLREDAP